MPAVVMTQILFVIKKRSCYLCQCQVHLGFSKFVDLCPVGFVPRDINEHRFCFLVWLSASGDG